MWRDPFRDTFRNRLDEWVQAHRPALVALAAALLLLSVGGFALVPPAPRPVVPVDYHIHPDPPCKGSHDWSCVTVVEPCPGGGERIFTLCTCVACGKSKATEGSCK